MRLSNRKIHHFRRQRGVVLFISLIVLVAMTLAGIALVRSVDTTNLIAGNLAFKQGATLAGDAAIEAGRNLLLTPGIDLTAPAPGYLPCTPLTTNPDCNLAGAETPGPQYDWSTINPSPHTGNSFPPVQDAAGNEVTYVIHRLCRKNGTTVGNSCINTAGTTGAGVAAGTSKGAGRVSIAGALQYYYRVTARITGPRNTVSYVQSIIQI